MRARVECGAAGAYVVNEEYGTIVNCRRSRTRECTFHIQDALVSGVRLYLTVGHSVSDEHVRRIYHRGK